MLGHADNQGESTEFVEFMLGMIRDALQEISKAQNEHDVVITVAKNVVQILCGVNLTSFFFGVDVVLASFFWRTFVGSLGGL